jgi:hypothetical protein
MYGLIWLEALCTSRTVYEIERHGLAFINARSMAEISMTYSIICSDKPLNAPAAFDDPYHRLPDSDINLN